MSRINYSSGSPFEKTIGFSRAVRAGDQIFISGTAPLSADGSIAFTGDLYLQTKTCLEIMKNVIEEAVGQWQNVVRTRIYLKNAYDWKEAASAHGELLSDVQPACTFIEVKGFIDPGWLIETEAHCII